MISIDSDGVENLQGLRSELCRVPRKHNANGMDQIMNKQEMKKLGIKSPNQSDSVMMSLFKPPIEKTWQPINYKTRVSIA